MQAPRTITGWLALLAAASLLAASSSQAQIVKQGPRFQATALTDESIPSGNGSMSSTQALLKFNESEIKFRVETLMAILRDRSHEGWVLAAYPDPHTRRPLIGAGFSLDVSAVNHPQPDPLNPRQFLEPSSAELWKAAGLSSPRLERILNQFDHLNQASEYPRHRKKPRLRRLPPQVTDQEATRLLRISAIQAISNAQAYCRGFDQFTASQQLALSQLVFQMGVNLEQFVQFLGTINADFPSAELSVLTQPAESEDRWNRDHWTMVQNTLIDSQWARLYSHRAATVIAMFDPEYQYDAFTAQLKVEAQLMPLAADRARVSGPFSPSRPVSSKLSSAASKARGPVHAVTLRSSSAQASSSSPASSPGRSRQVRKILAPSRRKRKLS